MITYLLTYKQTNKPANKCTHRQDQLQYNAPLSSARSVMMNGDITKSWAARYHWPAAAAAAAALIIWPFFFGKTLEVYWVRFFTGRISLPSLRATSSVEDWRRNLIEDTEDLNFQQKIITRLITVRSVCLFVDVGSVAVVSTQELPHGRLSQLETCVQCLSINVRCTPGRSTVCYVQCLLYHWPTPPLSIHLQLYQTSTRFISVSLNILKQYAINIFLNFLPQLKTTWSEKSAQRDANTARALAVVRFGHRPPARPLQTHKPTDRTDYNTLRRS